jgi:hypothetical protein
MARNVGRVNVSVDFRILQHAALGVVEHLPDHLRIAMPRKR